MTYDRDLYQKLRQAMQMRCDEALGEPPKYELAHRKIARCLQELCQRYPFHQALITKLRVSAHGSVDTMAVSRIEDQTWLFFSAGFALKHSDACIEGVLHHEVNHILFGHLDVRKDDFPHHQARLIAEEVTVNEYVSEPLPDAPLLLEHFPYLPPREDTDTRYHRLVAKLPDCEGWPQQPLDSHVLWPHNDSPEKAGISRNSDLVEWTMAQQARHVIVAPTRGTVDRSIGWEHEVARLLPTPRLARQPTWQRPPRRMPEWQGMVPALQARPEPPRVLAAIDTSGSITPVQLSHFNRELRRLALAHRVTVCECDREIRRTYPYHGPIRRVSGRGGTSFEPVFRRQFLREHRPEVVVYFTDGGGRPPRQRPHIPVIWCLTRNGRQPSPWGEVRRLSS